LSGGSKPLDFWAQTGRGLAQLHQHSAGEFGLDHDNYIGSLNQYNQKETDWVEFFVNQRLQNQLRMCSDHGHADAGLLRMFDRLFPKLEQYFPHEPPALLHGDLWSGNYLCGNKGAAYLVDPAVYYGHREMDLAMSLLFGGFDREMYHAYHEVFPLENGWKERVDLCNLYPLLVHVNLFGGSYISQVRAILKRFC
jgi:protein-ribulosamine 3-kinase